MSALYNFAAKMGSYPKGGGSGMVIYAMAVVAGLALSVIIGALTGNNNAKAYVAAPIAASVYLAYSSEVSFLLCVAAGMLGWGLYIVALDLIDRRAL